MILKGAVAIGGIYWMTGMPHAAELDYLAPTQLVQSDHPHIIALAKRIAPDDLPAPKKAKRIFDFVRDEIKFGFGPRFYEHTALEILEMRIGYCNTKGTLIVALLRAAGIPARQVFVDISADILHGIVDPGTPFVDHSYVEIRLGEKWLATDAYIVDTPLFNAAQKRLGAENRQMGYGVHSLGTRVFDEVRPSFSQLVADQQPSLTTRNYGIHVDVKAFYEATPEAWNRLRFITRRAFPVFALLANRNAENLRSS
jgi:transglutaminase-like putative cysteine protease